MKQLVVKPEKCIGCRTCELVCSFGHYQQFSPRLANITVLEYEAATLDGATKVDQFSKITLPLMKGIIKTTITFWSINATTFFLWSKMFSPIDTEASTIVPVIYLYDMVFGGKGVSVRDAGAGAAVGVLLTLIIIAIYAVMNLLLKDSDLEY